MLKQKFMEARKAIDSLTIMNELVLPNDTNHFENLLGGKLMYWMDIAAAICAVKHSGLPCMTVSVDNLSFKTQVSLGSTVTIEAKVSRAFNTSMEIHLKAWTSFLDHKVRELSNEAYFTFVALDENGKPTKIPELIPETDEEKIIYDGALKRRQLRLIFSGKMKAKDANELKDFFNDYE